MMNAALLHQAKYDLLMFRRNPAATFFTAILPVVFLILFVSLFGGQEYDNGRGVATFYVPGIMTLAIVSATLVNTALTVALRRERGILKRVRGTPIRPWVFIGGQIVAGWVISAVMMILMITIGALLFSVYVNPVGIAPLIISIIVGAACFSALGLAVTALIPSEDAAPAITNAIVLPLYFISDVFIPPQSSDGSDPGGFVSTLGSIFPVKHLANALTDTFDPLATTTQWPWIHWLALIIWGIVGAIATQLFFRWTPRR